MSLGDYSDVMFVLHNLHLMCYSSRRCSVCRVTEKWTTAAPMSNKRGDFAAAVLSGRLIVAGGLSESGLSVCQSLCVSVCLSLCELLQDSNFLKLGAGKGHTQGGRGVLPPMAA